MLQNALDNLNNLNGIGQVVEKLNPGFSQHNFFFQNDIFFIFTAVGDSKRIQLENMLGVYLVLAVGGCFSVIVVLVEIWWKKHGTNVMTVLRTKYSFMR